MVAIVGAARLLWQAAPGLVCLTGLTTLIQGAVPPALAVVSGVLVNRAVDVVGTGDTTPLLAPLVADIAILTAGRLSMRAQSMFTELLARRVTDHLGTLIVQRAAAVDLLTFEDPAFYARLNRVNASAVSEPATLAARVFGAGVAFVMLALSFVLLCQLSLPIAMLMVALAVPSFVVDTVVNRRLFDLRVAQSPLMRTQSYMAQLLTTDSHAKEVRALGSAGFLIHRYRDAGRRIYRQLLGLQTRGFRAVALAGLLTSVGMAVAYLLLAGHLAGRATDIGGFLQNLVLVNQVEQSLALLLDGLVGILRSKLFLTDLEDFHLEEGGRISHCATAVDDAAPEPAAAPSQAVISLHNAAFRYPHAAAPTLRDISFTVGLREKVAIVGRNGSGKTTLIKLLSGLYRPTSGSIRLLDADMATLHDDDVRRHVSVMFQDFNRYNMTVQHNIGLGSLGHVDDADRVAHAAWRSGVHQKIMTLPDTYTTMLGHMFDNGHDLSGGEWQKLAVARALVRAAPLLILDEPTSALDAQAGADLYEHLLGAAEERAVVFVAHDLGTVRAADRILVLAEGRIVEQGTHSELMGLAGVYRELADAAVPERDPGRR